MSTFVDKYFSAPGGK